MIPRYSANIECVIQRYLASPFLIDNKKNDLRLYVMVASLDPLVVYLNDEGLARFCSDDYQEPNPQNSGMDTIHLTNYSVNKASENYVLTEEIREINNGTKRTLESYWKSVTKREFSPGIVAYF